MASSTPPVAAIPDPPPVPAPSVLDPPAPAATATTVLPMAVPNPSAPAATTPAALPVTAGAALPADHPTTAAVAGPAEPPTMAAATGATSNKGRPPVWNRLMTNILLSRLPQYQKNFAALRRGDKGGKQRNEVVNSAVIDELGVACGWKAANLLAVGPDGKRTDGVRQDPVDVNKLDYAAQQVFEAKQIAWRRLVCQPVQSRMGSYTRNAQKVQETALLAQLNTLRATIGPEARPMQFSKFLVGHEVYGWRALLEDLYRAAHDGAVPMGNHALADRVAFATAWYKNGATQVERTSIGTDYEGVQDLTSVHTSILAVGEAFEGAPGDILDVEERFACSLGVQPLVSRVADGLSRSTGLSFMTLVAGHMNTSGAETMRTFGVGTDFGAAPTFQDWAPTIWVLICQVYMAYSRAALAFRIDGTTMPTFASLEASFKNMGVADSLPATPIKRGMSTALPSPMAMSTPSTPTVPREVTRAAHEDTAMASPTPPARSVPAHTPTSLDVQPSVREGPRCATPPTSAPALPSTPRAFTTSLFLPEAISPTPPASSPPPYTASPTPASHMPHPGPNTLLDRCGPALPRLRIATERVRQPYDKLNPWTPCLPSSPLVRSSFSAYDNDDKGDNFGIAKLLDSPLPPSLSQLKAYADGGASELQRAIPGNTGVLASEADIFSDDSPFVVRVDSTQQRVQLRVTGDAYASVVGGVIAVSGAGYDVSATGSQARAIAVMPAEGVAAVAFLRGGEARLNLARGRVPPPSSSPARSPMSPPPPSSPVCSDNGSEEESDSDIDLPGGKRKREKYKAALPASPEEPKRARNVYTSAAQRAREKAPTPAQPPPPAPTAPRRGRRSTASTLRVVAAPTCPAAPARAAATTSARAAKGGGARAATTASARPTKAAPRRRAAPTYRPSLLSGLTPAREGDLISAGLSAARLQLTALSKVADIIMLHAKQLGPTFVELLGHLIVLDTHVPEASFPNRLLVERPAQVRFFAKGARLFQPAVFNEFDSTFATRFWSWWGALTRDICYPAPGALCRPGHIIARADLGPLLRGGANGFGTIVVTLVLWIFGFMRTTPLTSTLTFANKPAATQVAAWSDAVAHVNYVAAAMVETLNI